MTIDLSGSALRLAGEAGLSLTLPLTDVAVRIVGLGWATVDLDRVAADLRLAEGLAFDVDVRDELLGARGRAVGPVPPDGIRLVILEPFTEGRLAASLARRGEGPAALYLAPTDSDLTGAIDRLSTGGVRTRSGLTALGPGAIVLGLAAAGPQLLLVAVPSGP